MGPGADGVYADQGMDSQRGVSRTANLPLVVDQRVLKEELRMTIMAKRHARGEGKISVDFTEPERRELSQSEVERKERRREQNRRAAQRCRRKKRMNQMSVLQTEHLEIGLVVTQQFFMLQNYDWILARNQQLLQEVETLRQDKDQLQSTLNAHLEVCTCSHAHKTSLHMLGGKVKVEPRDDSPTLHTRYAVPSPTPSSAASASCQYGGGIPPTAAADTPAAVSGSCGYSQAAGFQSVQYSNQLRVQGTSRGACSFSSFTQDLVQRRDQKFPVHVDTRCSPTSRAVSSAHSPHAHTPHTSAPPAAVVSSAGLGANLSPGPRQFVPSPISYTSTTHSVSDELALLRMSRGCVFQEEVATPLSNDGRQSISSMCSDLSTASEQHSDVSTTPEGSSDVVMNDFLDDDSAADVSELLSQINHNDLFFQQDDVFSDPALASIQDNFLQNFIPEN
nr:hypothetical protein BaRGS_035108 [Batillaria attramentaria]